MSSTQRILEQLLLTDRMIGVEAAPRARFAQPPAPEPIRASAARPGPPVRMASPAGATAPPPRIAPAPRPVPVAPPSGQPATWTIHAEIPLAASPAPVPLDILFIAVEWGQPFDAPVRELFNRQLGAMKVPQERAALLRLVWGGAQEPGPEALAEAKVRALECALKSGPKTVVLFGGFSIKAVCGGSGSLALSRGKWFPIEGSIAVARASWHPSQLGVDRDRRMQAWEDLQAVMAKLA